MQVRDADVDPTIAIPIQFRQTAAEVTALEDGSQSLLRRLIEFAALSIAKQLRRRAIGVASARLLIDVAVGGDDILPAVPVKIRELRSEPQRPVAGVTQRERPR